MVSTFKECKMHHELQYIGGNPSAERRRPNLSHTELLDLQQFGGKDAGIYVSTPSPRHYQANFYAWGGSSADNKVPFDSNSDAWNPFKRRDPFFPHQYSYNHDVFSSRPVYQSYSSVSGYADSGYESQAGADAQSLMSVPSHVESAHEFSGAPFEDCGPSYAPVIKENPLRCNKCSWTGKTQSQKKKHDARHAKAHRCEELGCDAGFGTKNDLERHRKAVHSKSPCCGPADRYKCFGKNCPHSEKVWPRLDNFKAHLDRKHNDETQEELIARSRAWYETWKKGAASVDTITPLKTLNNPGTYFDIFPENSRLNQMGNEPVFDKNVPAEIPIWQAGHDPAKKDPQPNNRKLPGVQTVLNPIMSESTDSISGDRGACTPEQRILPSVQAFERGVALMQALTVATLQNNGNQLNAGENASFSADNAMDISQNMPGMHAEKLPNISQLSNEETKFCLNMISKMHSQLTLQQASSSSSKSEASSPATKFENNEAIAIHGAEKGGHKCPNCPKTFSKQSLFKKHQKRHDKPYGCTFAGCYGEFGSKADWKRHESMQHYHVQCFRCSLPRRGGNNNNNNNNNNNKHAECASLFFHEDDFIQHLTETHQCMGERNIRCEIDKSRIGAYDHQSKFYYWCGFCRQIKLVEKRGVEAWNERFDHIEIEHFRKGENIKTWVPAKGHTMKGARKKRDKLRKGNSNNNRTSKRPGKRPLEDVEQQSDSNNNGRGEGDEVTAYEVCSTSEDDTDMEAKQLSNNYKLKHKIRRVHRSDEELACVFCCHCKDGPQTLVSERCMFCSHTYCANCQVENPVGQDMDFVPVAGQ